MGVVSSVIMSIPIMFKWAPAVCLCLMINECIDVYIKMAHMISLHPSVAMFGASCMAMVLMVVPPDFLNAFIAAKDTICHLKLLVVGDAEMVTLERMSTIYKTMRRYVFQPARLLCLFCLIVCSSAFFSGLCGTTLLVYSVLGFVYKKCLKQKSRFDRRQHQCAGVDVFHQVHINCY